MRSDDLVQRAHAGAVQMLTATEIDNQRGFARQQLAGCFEQGVAAKPGNRADDGNKTRTVGA
jgi:hypothetical protein